MANFRNGLYEVRNREKYVGNGKPRFRSGWEFTFMMFLDSNPNVINWASEAVSIPYRNPLTGKMSTYVPDFIVTYKSPNGTTIGDLIEIKPKKQSLIESRTASARDRAVVAVNHAKWAAATAYCKMQGFAFRVITEDDLFRNGSRK